MFPTFSDILAEQPKNSGAVTVPFVQVSSRDSEGLEKSVSPDMKWATDGWMDQDDITLLPPVGDCSESRVHDGDESTASGSLSESASGSELSGKASDEKEKTQCPPQLPSIGSAQHETGQCKPCLFFPRGNCTNGENCNFCHFEHEARKNKKKGGEVPENAKQTIVDKPVVADKLSDNNINAKSNVSSIVCPKDALSIGSVSHPDACTECQFFFFSQSGCVKGQDCEFCHEFHPRTNDKKNRRLLRRLAGLASRSTNDTEEVQNPAQSLQKQAEASNALIQSPQLQVETAPKSKENKSNKGKENKSSAMTLANLLSPPSTPRMVHPSVQFAPAAHPDTFVAPLPYPPIMSQHLMHSVPPMPSVPCPMPPVHSPMLDQAATSEPVFEPAYVRQPMFNQAYPAPPPMIQGPVAPPMIQGGALGLPERGAPGLPQPPHAMPGQHVMGDQPESYQSHFQKLLQMELEKKWGKSAPPPLLPGVVSGPPSAPPPGLPMRPPPGLEL